VCATINTALDKSSPGDTIYVTAGTYTHEGIDDEVVYIDRDIPLSDGWDSTFAAQAGASTVDGKGWAHGITVDESVTATLYGHW
jgi:hypothetical protein